jgi:hypothetical protein
MTLSTTFQILGSLFIFAGYWLNAKNHARQHMLFIFGHVFLIAFSAIEYKWVLVALSVFVIFMQYKASQKKYKFKKDIVRIKKVARRVKPQEFKIDIKNTKHENKRVHKADSAVGGNRNKKGHIV